MWHILILSLAVASLPEMGLGRRHVSPRDESPEWHHDEGTTLYTYIPPSHLMKPSRSNRKDAKELDKYNPSIVNFGKYHREFGDRHHNQRWRDMDSDEMDSSEAPPSRHSKPSRDSKRRETRRRQNSEPERHRHNSSHRPKADRVHSMERDEFSMESPKMTRPGRKENDRHMEDDHELIDEMVYRSNRRPSGGRKLSSNRSPAPTEMAPSNSRENEPTEQMHRGGMEREETTEKSYRPLADNIDADTITAPKTIADELREKVKKLRERAKATTFAHPLADKTEEEGQRSHDEDRVRFDSKWLHHHANHPARNF